MSVRESPGRFATAVGGVSALAWALTVFFVFAYPLLVLPDGAEPAYLDAWFHPVAAVGGSIATYGVPLLVAVGGYYFARRIASP